MDTISDQESALFRDWRDSRKNLVPDGVVDESKFLRTSPKLVFVLKEVNGIHSEGWDLRAFLREGGRSATWNNITRWIAALSPGGDQRSWSEVEPVDKALMKERLRSIAAMNLKKTSGGGSSDRKEIERFAREDAAFIERQFSLYDPHLVVFCGVRASLIPQFQSAKSHRTARGIEYREYEPGKYGISFCHPQARYRNELMYYALADAAEELRSRG